MDAMIDAMIDIMIDHARCVPTRSPGSNELIQQLTARLQRYPRRTSGRTALRGREQRTTCSRDEQSTPIRCALICQSDRRMPPVNESELSAVSV
jgi:hypothetical protein